jgi:hypothetical protein
MKKSLFLIILNFVCITGFSQDMKGKWTSEFTLNFGIYPNSPYGAKGIEYGAGAYYHILNRLGVSAQLHSFQGIIPFAKNKNYHVNDPITQEELVKPIENYSVMLFNVNLFGDIFVTPKNNRLRLQAGATYTRGSLSFVNIAGFNMPTGVPDRIISNYIGIINTIGLNARLSYLINLSDKCYMTVNSSVYMCETKFWEGDPFFDTLNLGVAFGYKF